MPTMNVPFVIDSTLTTDDSSLAGTVGKVSVYRKVQDESQKVTARIYSLDGDALDVAVAVVAAIAHAERANPPEAGRTMGIMHMSVKVILLTLRLFAGDPSRSASVYGKQDLAVQLLRLGSALGLVRGLHGHGFFDVRRVGRHFLCSQRLAF